MSGLSLSQFGFSTASLAGHSIPEACRLGHDLGFTVVEFLAFAGYRHSRGEVCGFYYDRMTPDEQAALRELASGFRHVTTHAPFFELPILSPNPALRETAVRQLEIAIEATAAIGGELTVTHAAPKATHTLEQSWDELVALYRHLGDLAAEQGVRVTIETTYPPTVTEFAELIWEIDHPAVGANVDVGHLVPQVPAELRGTEAAPDYYNDLLEQHLRSLGSKLYHFHLHDVRAGDLRDHRACGRGIIDYARVLRVAAELDYQGVFVFELEEPDMVEALTQCQQTIADALPTPGNTTQP
ncbi:MAG: sugar phosphate isomerase/epimerase family protein [Armatimonadota bacterium]